MESFFGLYKAYFYGIGIVLLGIISLVFIKAQKRKETEEDRNSEYKYSVSKSVDFSLYLGGIFFIVIGILIILRELLS